MGLWSRIEQRLWTGPVVQDYGLISEGKGRVFTRRVSVLLAERGDMRRLFIRESGRVPLGMNSLLELDREAAEKLLEALEDALPQIPEDPSDFFA
jgi:hypothetical protein